MAEHGETPTDEPFKPDWMNYMQGFLDGAAEEREECAQVCEDAIASIWEYSPEDVKQTGKNVCNNLAAAIRARGKK